MYYCWPTLYLPFGSIFVIIGWLISVEIVVRPCVGRADVLIAASSMTEEMAAVTFMLDGVG